MFFILTKFPNIQITIRIQLATKPILLVLVEITFVDSPLFIDNDSFAVFLLVDDLPKIYFIICFYYSNPLFSIEISWRTPRKWQCNISTPKKLQSVIYIKIINLFNLFGTS